ncbi:hypothetical protein [Streptomyces sp. NPDC007074]|uniref:hypothetical protein n=1 Tax=Streptomyces sp. NPDC007074 TaxID=3156764 RepID=UPI0033E26ADC
MEIAGTDSPLTDFEVAWLRHWKRRKIGRRPINEILNPHSPRGLQVFSNEGSAISEWSYLSGIYITTPNPLGISNVIASVANSGEALVPHFNSPPSEWTPLRVAAEQASAIGIGVSWGGGSVPALIGSYVGGLFIVKFVSPIVTEAGNATADGVGAKIRAALGVAPPVDRPARPGGNQGESAETRNEQAAEAEDENGG